MDLIKNRYFKTYSIAFGIILVYSISRPFLINTGIANNLELVISIIIILTNIILLAVLLITIILRGILSLFKVERRQLVMYVIKKQSINFFIAISFLVIITIYTQVFSYTPKIVDSNGNEIENSISILEKVRINDSNQWISIRGKSKDNPVLLFLAGGPGGTQMAATREELNELEDHFVVVNWDQPGSGKSYNAIGFEELTLDRYLSDAHELTKILKDRFDEEKIYVIGESWGSALGILLIDKHPNDYHAFIGTGQMVSFLDTEIIDYNKALQIAYDNDDTVTLQELQEQGEPPYYGKDVVWKTSAYLMYLSDYMAHDPNIKNRGYNTIRDVSGPEYGLYDKVNFFRGVTYTFNNVYQKLYDVDLRDRATDLDVPVYFFIGRHDLNAPVSLTEEYYNLLEAPDKDLVWFEHSGHSPWLNENELFINKVIEYLN